MKYVTDIIGDEYREWTRGSVVLLTAPTGSGKTTFVFKKLLPYVIAQKGKMLYLVNRTVLKKQLEGDLKKEKNAILLENATALKPINEYITIMTYQQLERQIMAVGPYETQKKLKGVGVVVYDECHYFYNDSSFNTYTEVSYDLLRYIFRESIQIFMSATMENVEPFIEKRVYQGYGYRVFQRNPLKYGVCENYEYVTLKVFNDIQEIEKIIMNQQDKQKWLIFTDSIEAGKKLQKTLSEKVDEPGDVGFLDANYDQDEEGREIVEEISEKQRTRKRVLIATAVIDNGVSFHDYELRNLVILADTKESFIQMLGRKRSDDQNVTVYICRRDRNHFLWRLNYVTRVIEFYEKYAEKINGMHSKYEEHESGYVYPCIKELELQDQIHRGIKISAILHNNMLTNLQQKAMREILSNSKAYGYARKMLYVINGCLAVNSFSIQRFRQLSGFYQQMIEEIEKDENAFVKLQAGWLGKKEEEVQRVIDDSNENLDEQHRRNLENVISNYLGKRLSDQENQKLKKEIKEEVVYFSGRIDRKDAEIAKQVDRAVTSLGKNDRNLSTKDFELFMKISELHYHMRKIEGDFVIEK